MIGRDMFDFIAGSSQPSLRARVERHYGSGFERPDLKHLKSIAGRGGQASDSVRVLVVFRCLDVSFRAGYRRLSTSP